MNAAKKTKENGRDRLITSALKLFSEKSFHAVSVREICEDAQANLSLISFHFGGKDSLLEAIFQEQLLSPSFKRMENILSTPESLHDFRIKLEYFLDNYVDFYLRHKEVCCIYLEELEKGHELAQKILPQTFGIIWQRLQDFIREAQKQKFLNSDIDAHILCFQIMSPFICLIRGRSTHLYNKDGNLEDEVFKKQLVQQIISSLRVNTI